MNFQLHFPLAFPSHYPVGYFPAVICSYAAELSKEAFLLKDHLLALCLCQHEAAFCPIGSVRGETISSERFLDLFLQYFCKCL